MESNFNDKMTATQEQRALNDKEVEEIYGKNIMDLTFSEFLNCTIKDNDGIEPEKDVTVMNYENFLKQMSLNKNHKNF